MIIEEHTAEKYVVIWISNAEKTNEQIQANIQSICAENNRKKIQTVIFYSGLESLKEQTSNLLALYAERSARSQKITCEDIDLFTTLWYNYLIGKYPFER